MNALSNFLEERRISEETAAYFNLTETTYRGKPAIAYPTRTARGRVKYLNGASGQKVEWTGEHGIAVPKFYHNAGFKHAASGTLYFMGGEPDVWVMHSAGYDNTVCMFGESNRPEGELLAALAKYQIRRVVCVPDCDDTGRAMAEWLRGVCHKASVKFTALELPGYDGFDAGKYRQAVSLDEFKAAMYGGLPVMEFVPPKSTEPPAPKDDAGIPHNVDAERALLGSILINPDVLIDVMAHIEEPAAFFLLRHGWIFEAILRLRNRREAIDYLTLISELQAMGRLKELGGRAYLISLLGETPTSIHAETYARRVASAYMRRRIMQAGQSIISAAGEDAKEDEEIIGECETALSKALLSKQQTGYTFEQLAGEMYDKIAYYLDHPDKEYGLSCGIRAIDDIVQGMEKGNMHIIAGATSIGKTSLMLSMALAMAFAKKRILFYSLEMSKEQLFARACAIMTGINSRLLLRGKVSSEQLNGAILNALERLSKLDIILEAPGSLTPATLKHQGVYYVRRHQMDAIFIDGLWLMSMSGSRAVGQDTSETGAVSQGVKAAAKDLNVPIIIAHQLSRSFRDRANKRPILTDLVDSSKVEQNSDVVMFAHRDSYWEAQADPNTEDKSGVMEVEVAKNRNGPTGTAKIWYHRELTYCTDIKHERHEQP